ncbi:hypothetical protein Tco_0107051, partial [Tanacetum coccineum]
VILYSVSPPSPPYDFFDHHRSLPSHQPSTYVTAFVEACNLYGSIRISLQPMWQPL